MCGQYAIATRRELCGSNEIVGIFDAVNPSHDQTPRFEHPSHVDTARS
jgi:hypothetical protein